MRPLRANSVLTDTLATAEGDRKAGPSAIPLRSQVLVIITVGLIVVGGIRGIWIDDAHFAWRMYAVPITYRLEYWLVPIDRSEGARALWVPPIEKRSTASARLRRDVKHESWYGVGAVSHLVNEFCEFLDRSGLIPPGQRLEVDLSTKRLGSEWTKSTLTHP